MRAGSFLASDARIEGNQTVMTPCIVCCRYVRTEADLVLCTICVQRLFTATVESKIQLRDLLIQKNRPRAAEMIESFLPQDLRRFPGEAENRRKIPLQQESPKTRKQAPRPRSLSVATPKNAASSPLPSSQRITPKAPKRKRTLKAGASAPITPSRRAPSPKPAPEVKRKTSTARPAKPLPPPVSTEKPKRKRSRTTRKGR